MSETKLKKHGTNIDMTEGNPTRLLILFAIPMLIGGVFQLLYNMVDTVVVGRYVSVDALAAIGATGSTTSFVLMMGLAVTNALSVIVSQAEGAKDYDQIKKAVTHGYYAVVIAAFVLGLLSFFGARPFMELLGTSSEIIDQSVIYIRIVCGLTIAMLLYNSSASILRAIGDSRTPLYFLIFSSIMNVGLDLFFVIKLGLGVMGVACATVITQLLSAVLCNVYMFASNPRLRPDKKSWKPDGQTVKQYLKISLPMVVQNFMLNVGMFVITYVINSFGKDTMAAYTIGSRVEQLATVTFSNVAFSFSVYAGQNFGAKKFERIRQGLRKGLGIVGTLALVSTAVMMIFARPLAAFFMDEPNETVITQAVAMIRIEAAMFIMLGAIWTVNSALRGVGAVGVTLVSSIVELASKILLSIFLSMLLGYIGVWMAAPIGWLLGLIPSAVYFAWWFRHVGES